MENKLVSGIVITLLLMSMLTLAFRIQPAIADSATIYVDDDNIAGPWDGTMEHPYQNITSGLEHAVSDDLLFVFGGYYPEYVLIDKSVSLVGEDKLATTIDAHGATKWAIDLGGTRNVNISGFTIRNEGFMTSGINMVSASQCNISGNIFPNLFEAISVNSIYDYYDNCTIGENYIEDVNTGIVCVGANNTVSKNNITRVMGEGWGAGIKIINAADNTISDNNITQVALKCYGAIKIEGREGGSSNSNIVSGNYIANSLSGICFDGSAFKNVVMGNTVTDCHSEGDWLGAGILVGIHSLGFGSSDENTIVGNNVTQCDKGIDLLAVNNNIVCHNYLVNNAINGREQKVDTDNQWDDGYPSGGNYWSEYTGIDQYRGSAQNEEGSDGIGDTQYNVRGSLEGQYNGIDRYPLMKPCGGANDVGIVSVATSKSVVLQSWTMKISVKILNYGFYAENCHLAVRANSTVIASQDVVLTSRNSTTLIFAWNTAGFDIGSYNITAQVLPVDGETCIEDNTYVHGWVAVTFFCDVNGDESVDMADISLMIEWFMTTPPDWNPNCDVNGDLSVDMADISIAIDNFMQTEP